MPQVVVWEEALRTGHAALDAQHEALLAQCNRLADLCGGKNGPADDAGFDEALAQLKALAQQHFESEAAQVAADADAAEDLQAERDEYEYLLREVATAANFDRLEVQRFLALWWFGHVRSTAAEAAAARA